MILPCDKGIKSCDKYPATSFIIHELTSPCYLSKKTCFQLYQNASEAIHENTTNNRTLAEVVMELAGLRCGEIELDDEI